MNVDRLLRVRDSIQAAPERFEMVDDFVTPRFDAQGSLAGCDLCIAAIAALDAGFIILRNTPRPGAPRTFYDVTETGSALMRISADHPPFMMQLGADALDLTDAQAGRLFFISDWPKDYRQSFYTAPHAKARAAIAARRIGRYIDTDGRE